MHRIEGDGFVVEDGKNRYTEDGNTPTVVTDEAMNAIQEELCNLITACGVTVESTASDDRTNNWEQLVKAILNANALGATAMSTALQGFSYSVFYERDSDNAIIQSGSIRAGAYQILSRTVNPVTGIIHGATIRFSFYKPAFTVSQGLEKGKFWIGVCDGAGNPTTLADTLAAGDEYPPMQLPLRWFDENHAIPASGSVVGIPTAGLRFEKTTPAGGAFDCFNPYFVDPASGLLKPCYTSQFADDGVVGIMGGVVTQPMTIEIPLP